MEDGNARLRSNPLDGALVVVEGVHIPPVRTVLGDHCLSLLKACFPLLKLAVLKVLALAGHGQHNLVSLLSLQAGPQRPLSSYLVFGRGPWKVWGGTR